MNAQQQKDGDNIPIQLLFLLGTELYGIDVDYVISINEMERIVTIPHTPPFIMGVINLSGKVIPILNLATRFGLKSTIDISKKVLIVVEMNGVTAALTVDKVIDVKDLNDLTIKKSDGTIQAKRENKYQIIPPSPLLITAESRFIVGLAQLRSEFIKVNEDEDATKPNTQTEDEIEEERVDPPLIIMVDLNQILSRAEQTNLKELNPFINE